MKRFVLLAVLLVALGMSAQAFAQGPVSWSGGWGAFWMDGQVSSTTSQGSGYGAVAGTGTGVPLLNGQGYGPGDGTLPAPQDGTGFGSPWVSQ